MMKAGLIFQHSLWTMGTHVYQLSAMCNSMFSFGPHIWLLKTISSKGPRAGWLELLCRREPAKVPPAETPCLSHSDDILISVTPELIRGTEMLIDQNLAHSRCKDCGCSLKCLRFLWYCQGSFQLSAFILTVCDRDLCMPRWWSNIIYFFVSGKYTNWMNGTCFFPHFQFCFLKMGLCQTEVQCLFYSLCAFFDRQYNLFKFISMVKLRFYSLLYILQVLHYLQFFKDTIWKITLSEINFVIYGVYGGTTGFCSHWSSLPILLPSIRTMRRNSPWDSQMLSPMESEVPTELLQCV